jgi:thiamine phosphate synthase YjbQ (UPF0047 family)
MVVVANMKKLLTTIIFSLICLHNYCFAHDNEAFLRKNAKILNSAKYDDTVLLFFTDLKIQVFVTHIQKKNLIFIMKENNQIWKDKHNRIERIYVPGQAEVKINKTTIKVYKNHLYINNKLINSSSMIVQDGKVQEGAWMDDRFISIPSEQNNENEVKIKEEIKKDFTKEKAEEVYIYLPAINKTIVILSATPTQLKGLKIETESANIQYEQLKDRLNIKIKGIPNIIYHDLKIEVHAGTLFVNSRGIEFANGINILGTDIVMPEL